MEAPNAAAQPEGAVVSGGTVASYCHVHLASDGRLASALVAAARRGMRLASLQPTATEMLGAILGVDGARRRLVGISEWCDYPEALVEGKEVISRSAVQVPAATPCWPHATSSTLLSPLFAHAATLTQAPLTQSCNPLLSFNSSVDDRAQKWNLSSSASKRAGPPRPTRSVLSGSGTTSLASV